MLEFDGVRKKGFSSTLPNLIEPFLGLDRVKELSLVPKRSQN